MKNNTFEPGYSFGELVILGFNGKSLSNETIRTIQEEGVTQFILFTAPNFENKEQLIVLTDHLQSFSVHTSNTAPFLISADQEGGLVQRFKNGFTILPKARKVGDRNSAADAFEFARIQAKELFAAGLNLNFAPVCDINTNPANPVIGERAYGDDVDKVTRMTSASVRGHLTEGVEACIKHFPGHGDTHVDSHHALPTVTTPIETLRQREWVPFHRSMKAGCNFVMSAHLMLPHLDPNLPGTLSPTFMQKYLREELKFQGVIVSDDMQMGAIVENYGKEDAPVMALQAGCDLLCYRSEDQTLIALEAIKKAVQDGKLSKEKLKQSVDRVRKVRTQLRKVQTEMSITDRLQVIGHPDHQKFVSEKFS